jgi:hypothetical protein
MTREQKAIKLAEFEGWRKEYIHGNGMDCDVWIHPNGKDCFAEEWFPNYFEDLNSIRKLEEKLTGDQWFLYRDELRLIVLGPIRMVSEFAKADIHASAEQKSEALGKALNLW